MNVPAHITRFEKLRQRGRIFYLLSTAFSVAGVITAIQWFNGGTDSLSWQSIGLYALAGAAIAQVDWLVLSKRYDAHQNPKT